MSGDDPWSGLRRWTSARIALGRTGNSLPTRRVLDFQLAHAQARDAVHHPLDARRIAHELSAYDPVQVRSQAADRMAYLTRPDLGRRLALGAEEVLKPGAYDAVVILADGLSARAVHENGPALAHRLRQARPDWAWAPVVIATQARVALGDRIAERLGAPLVAVLIGERPGLTASDSLGAYITWRPRPGVTRYAERNCVSNIRTAGLPISEAASRIAALMTAARRLGVTGVALKEDDAFALSRDARPVAALKQPAGS